MSDQYEGMIIHHLEDFSNKFNLDIDHPNMVIGGRSVLKTVPSDNQIQRSIFGNFFEIQYGNTRSSDYYVSSNGAVGTNLRLMSSKYLGGHKLDMRVTRYQYSNGSFGHYKDRGMARVGINMKIPDIDRRVIVSFDYIPGSVELMNGVSSRGHVARMTIREFGSNPTPDSTDSQTGYPLFSFNKWKLSGKFEFVFESGRLKVFFRNKLEADITYTSKRLFFGQTYIQTAEYALADFPSTDIPFSIANLALVSVPLESPIRRLGNCRIQRSLVNDLDGTVQDETSPLNGESTKDGKSLAVDHGTQTIKFAPIELEDGENIIGTQMVLSGTNTETGSNLETIVDNAEEELIDKTHTLIETHLSREVIGDFILGEQPEDYSEVALKVRSVEV